MTERPTILLAGDACEKLVKARWPEARVVGTLRDLALVEYFVSDLRVDAVVVDPRLATKGETFDQWLNRFRSAFPGIEVVVAQSKGQEPAFSLEKEGGATAPKFLTSQTVIVWSPKGGVGKTFLATNLACAAAISTKGKTGLIDLDLYSPDVSVHLDLLDGPTITDLLPVISDLRPDGLDKYAQRHGPSGLNVICGPRRPELSELVTVDHIKKVLSLAEKRWGLVFVDTPPDITSEVVGECVEQASKIVLVTGQDPPALRQCKVAMEIFHKLGIKQDSVMVVLNRASKESPIHQEKVEEFLGVELAGVVPEDRKTVERSVFEGKPVALYAKTEISDAIWEVASRITPAVHWTKDHKKQSRLRRGLFW
ncbi:MAG: P-loop NTPase [Candidatus Fermentithermobacillus carboniphilus]|uniref:P-loop NTPase n=1 Tax=Candidatus Fermentithermobacillus carboniphilus TaxID=3085328 RepID=A0AAT9LCY4_9FIRM|nr:MAG: P-loop NTPase [Candidatus Fermentithermobacillus carboniphilus]